MQIPCPFDRTGPTHTALAQRFKRRYRVGHAESQPDLIAYVSCDQCKLSMDRKELIGWVRRRNALDISILGPIKLPHDWWKTDWPLADDEPSQFLGGSQVNINDAFPSKYIAAADLKGQDVEVMINRIEMEEIGQDKNRLPVLYFNGKDKGLVLNKTNTFTIGDLHGEETDTWPGKAVTLFPTQVDFQGKQVACIRVRINSASAASDQAPTEETTSTEDDTDIPF